MTKFIIAVVMLVWGIFQVFSGYEYGLILGNIWIVGSILMAWIPKP